MLGGFVSQVILFAVRVARLATQKTINAAEFCGFGGVGSSPAQCIMWSVLAFLPSLTRFMPFVLVAIWKTHAATSGHSHLRSRNITALIGKVICWGYAIALCKVTENLIVSDPAMLLPNDTEVQWTFGQILSVVSLTPILLATNEHLGKMPSYPIPDFEPSHCRLSLYFHLICHCISFLCLY